MSEGSKANRVYSIFLRVFIAIFVLVIFLGLGALVYVGRLNGEALILLSGVIIGYLARMGIEVI